MRYKVFWISLLATVLLSLFMASRIERLLPGSYKIKLMADCLLITMDKTLQPAFTLALACPGVDMIRLWPLPIIFNWIEDPDLPEDSLEAKTDQNLNNLEVIKDLSLWKIVKKPYFLNLTGGL